MSWQQVIAKDIVKGRLGGSGGGGAKKYTNYTNEKLLADAWDDDKTDQLIADITVAGNSGYTNVIKLLAPFKGKTKNEIGTMLHRDSTYGSIIDDMEDSLNLHRKELIEKIKTNLVRMARVGKGGTTIEAVLSQLKNDPSLEDANQLRELVNNKDSIETEMNGIITNAELRKILEDLYPEQPKDEMLYNKKQKTHDTLQVRWGAITMTSPVAKLTGWKETELSKGRMKDGVYTPTDRTEQMVWEQNKETTSSRKIPKTHTYTLYKIIDYTKDSPQAIMQEAKDAVGEGRSHIVEILPLGLILMGEKGERETVSQEGSKEGSQEYERITQNSVGLIPRKFFSALKDMKGSADELLPSIDNAILLSPIFFSDGKGFKFGRIAKSILFGENKYATHLTLGGLDSALDQVPLIKRGGEDNPAIKTRAYNEYSTEYLVDLMYNYGKEDSPIPKTDENDEGIDHIKDLIGEKYGDESIDVEDAITEINGFDTLEKLNVFMKDTTLTDSFFEGEDQKRWKTNPLASHEGERLQFESPSFFEDDDSTPEDIERFEANRLQSKKELSIRFLKTILLDKESFDFMNVVVKTNDEAFESNNKMFNAIVYGLENDLLDIFNVRFQDKTVEGLIKSIFTVAIRYDTPIETLIEKLKVEDRQYVPQEGDNEILEAIDIRVRAVWAKINSGFIEAINNKINEIAKLGNHNVTPLLEQGLVKIKGEVEE